MPRLACWFTGRDRGRAPLGLWVLAAVAASMMMGTWSCKGEVEGIPHDGATGATGQGGASAGAGGRLVNEGSGGALADAGATAGGGGGASGGAGQGAGGAPVDAGRGGTGASTGGSTGSLDAAADQGGTSTARCPPSALICEDFEAGNLNAWNRVVTSGTLAVDSTHAAGGSNALLVSIPANQRGGFIERTGAPLFPLPSKVMWGRVMIYFDGVVPDGHTDFVRGATAAGGTPWYNVGEQHGEILLNYYNGAAFDCWARPRPGRVVPLKTWMCWEWNFDGNTNQMQFFIDGQLSRQVNATGDGCLSGLSSTWTAPTFGALRIGAYIAETGATSAQIWMDDIAVGVAGRMGCPPAP